MRRWVAWAAATFLFLLVTFHRFALGVIAADLMAAFATMIGLTAMVGNLGGFLAGGPFALLVAAAGWRASFVTVGALTALVGGALLLAVRDQPVQTAARPAAVPPALWPAAAALLRDGKIWLALMTKMGFDMAFFAFFVVWGVPFLTQTTGVSPTVAGFHLSFGALGFMLGGPVLGFLSDRVMRERRRPILLSALAHTALWALLLGSAPLQPGAGLAALMAGLGFTAAGLLLCLACAKELSPPETTGIATALVNGGGFFGGAVLQIVLGVILDSRWDGATVAGARLYPLAAYLRAFSLCLVIMVATCLVAFFIREAGVLRTAPADALGTSGYKM